MQVSDSFPNLINGVSQQAEALRLNSQVDRLENAYCSVVDGLHKRQPTQHVKKILSADYSDAFVHPINRDSTERYFLVAKNNTLKVFNLAGVEQTLSTPDGTGYLTITGTGRESFRACTIADTTFLVNREKTVAMAATTSTALLPAALIWVRQGLVGHEYNVEIDGVVVATYSDDSQPIVKTTEVADSLFNDIVAALSGTFTLTKSENLIYIRRLNGAAFTIKVYDSYGNQAMILVKDQVQSFGDLPSKAFPGMVVKVVGDQDAADDYWVTFVPDSVNTFGKGSWSETVGPGVTTTLDAATMPWIIQRTGASTFTLSKASWSLRTAGDATSAPQPSFVGKTLNDVFCFRGRLGFLAAQNVIFSQANEFFNFWPTTVTSLLDDARIDYRVGGTNVATLYHAVPFQDQLILFSDQSQLTLTGGETLTQKTVSATVSTFFDSLPHVRPVNAGTSVFFLFSRGSFSGMKELFVNPDADSYDAADISAHVPEYVGVAKGLSVSTSLNTAVILAGTNSAFIYQWLWSDNTKVQSAWHTWTFDGQPLAFLFFSEVLYTLIQRDNVVWLEKIELTKKEDTGLDYLVHMDRKVEVEQDDYDEVTDVSEFAVPWYSEDLVMISEGQNLTIVDNEEEVDGTSTVTVRGDHEDAYAGVPYNFLVTFTKPFIKTEAKAGGFVAVNGRVQIGTFNVRYANSGYFQATVRADRYNTHTTYFTGRILGSENNVLGEVAIESGVFTVPIRARNEEMVLTISSDKFMPCFLLSAEWKGKFISKSRRV